MHYIMFRICDKTLIASGICHLLLVLQLLFQIIVQGCTPSEWHTHKRFSILVVNHSEDWQLGTLTAEHKTLA